MVTIHLLTQLKFTNTTDNKSFMTSDPYLDISFVSFKQDTPIWSNCVEKGIFLCNILDD